MTNSLRVATHVFFAIGLVAAVCSCTDRRKRELESKDPSRVFAASEMHRERVAKRLEIACRLRRPEFADHVMREEDLKGFRLYAEEEFARWKEYPGNPAVMPTVLNVTDFGARGDGVTANDAAFARATEAVKACGGRPTVLKIPSGTYYFKGCKDGSSHVDLLALTNCLVTGEGADRTCLLFGEPDCIGVRFDGCCNSTLAAVEMYWKTCPFSQGVVEKVDKSTDPYSLVIRHVKGTKRPDDPHFRLAKRAQVCGAFDSAGHQVLGVPLFFDVTDPKPAEDLGNGRFRIKLDRMHRESYEQMNVKVGMTVVLPDRVNGITAVRAQGARFCNFDSVWVRNSPEAAFTTGGEYITAWKCRVFPLERRLRLSTNADAFFNSPGTFLGKCEFRNMNDDGANCHYHGVSLASANIGARTLRFAQHGISSFRRGEPMQVYRAKTGELVVTLHVESCRTGTDKSGRYCEVKVREPLPECLVTMESLGLGELTAAQRYALSHGVGEKPKKLADVIYAPHGRGLGYVVTGCTFADIRGIAVNAQCPNSLIENNIVEHCNHGVQVSSLMMWYEGLPCYNLVVRGNVFRHTLRGVNAYLSTVDGGVCKTDYLQGSLVEGNSYDSVRHPVRFRNFRGLEFKDAVSPDLGDMATRSQCDGCHEARRPLVETQVRDGVGHVMSKIHAGREVTVAYLGASITSMEGWRTLSFDWLRKRYPQATFRMVDAALGGTTSALGVFRCGADVIAKKPDLVFIQFTGNDSALTDTAIWENYDGMIRQIWRANPETDIVIAYTFASRDVADGRSGVLTRAQSATDRVAEHYGLPSVAFGVRVLEELNAGRLVMSLGEVKDVAPSAASGQAEAVMASLAKEGKTLYSEDGVHPTMPGHRLYLESFKKFWQSMEGGKASDHMARMARPFYSARLEAAKTVPVERRMMSGCWRALPRPQGCETNLMWWYERRVGQLWQASRPGDCLRFRFKGTTCKIFDLMGPNGAFVRIRVDGKDVGRVKRFDSYCVHHRLAEFLVYDGVDGEHAVELEVDGEIPDRREILSRHPDADLTDGKYQGTAFIMGKIELVGDLIP